MARATTCLETMMGTCSEQAVQQATPDVHTTIICQQHAAQAISSVCTMQCSPVCVIIQ